MSAEARTYPANYVPPKKFALVISCVDVRLLDDLLRFLQHDNLTNRYYHVALAGASLGVSLAEQGTPVEGFQLAAWEQMLNEHIRLTLALTKNDLSDIYIVEHRDCGAYRKFLGVDFEDSPHDQDEEKALHQLHAVRLTKWIQERFDEYIEADPQVKQPRIRCFLMDLRGDVEAIDAPPHVPRRRAAKKRGR